ncbi:hypothetical protein M407DRAFT_30281 [Tulasnella calospora MUT 4182]|uniref:CFEM domain-containing protein n=1 Tax=Tulasnella calospora MUT 4182 TaxID=1051891 RepID=A0A0C3KF01_9AGAM|nr:hypothetical protein M407DRAFT_30281 [Tulasnella calospora MUT 4182]
MRLSVVILFAASLVPTASVFKRHNDHEVPWCAKDCVAHADPSPCEPDDTACLCVNENYYTEVATCVQSNCSPEDAKAAAEVGMKYCKGVGIDPENPIPKCGIQCVEQAPPGNCYPDDNKCLCENKDFLESVVWCFKKSCQGEDLKKPNASEKLIAGRCTVLMFRPSLVTKPQART